MTIMSAPRKSRGPLFRVWQLWVLVGLIGAVIVGWMRG
jgi:hypothetical protein